MLNQTLNEDFQNRSLFLENHNNHRVLAKLIDHTLLRIDATDDDFLKLFAEANQFLFKSVCVPPACVALAKHHCSQVSICTVIGFPNGYSTTESKIFETKDAIANGADELDFVNNIIYVKSKQWNKLQLEYEKIVEASDARITKLILETSLLTPNEIIKCTELAAEAGVNIIKTSTGFGKRGASTEDIDLIASILNKYQYPVGIKASGGIRTYEDALLVIKHGATRIGTSSGVLMIEN